MSGVITLAPMTLVAGWVSKNLLFVINSPPLTGPLVKYSFHMILEKDGETVYEEPLDAPDAQGRIYARDKDVDPLGGVIILSGLYVGEFDLRNDKVNPVINGRCFYRQDHGRYLTFNVEPIIAQSGSVSSVDTDTTTQSDPTRSLSATSSFTPGGIGGSITGSRIQPGDQRARGSSTGQILNVTSVRGLSLSQVSAPRRGL